MSEEPGGAITALARACGVETTHIDWRDREVAVPPATIRAVLSAMDLPVDDDAEAAEALEALRQRTWRRILPPSVVLRQGDPAHGEICVPAGARVTARCILESGEELEIPVGGEALGTRAIDGETIERRAIGAPAGGRREHKTAGGQHELRTMGGRREPETAELPVGYHRLVVRAERPGGDDREAEALLVVAPSCCPVPRARAWGWMVQLYAVRSADSWGMGDLADLRRLAEWSGSEHGAGFVLCNPLHAATPVTPQIASPYFPSSRRFTNPLYLRVDEVPEAARIDADDRARLDRLARQIRTMNHADRINRDVIHETKRDALELLHAVPRTPPREAAYRAYRDRTGTDLTDFATFCALAERHGVPFQSWPDSLRHPGSSAVREARRELAARVDFHAWLQWLCDEQLAGAQEAATRAGMGLGVIHDLAVGVEPGGADAWALQDELATSIAVGAPPDAFNQLGQDWQLPPLRPDRLAETGYAPFIGMLRPVLRHGGGIRIDHVMGLFRLYWIPEGCRPSEGAYVRYPADELLGVLSLEAHRAGATVVGEDLGTVERGVREELADRRILGSRVVYFERTPGGDRRPSADYPELALSSVNTHDLPTAAGWWDDGGVGVKARLGLLDEDTTVEHERQRARADQRELAELLRREGLLGANPTRDDLVAALHAFLARSPSLLVAASLADAVGDPRQPNLPGTDEEYPNWRLPIARPTPDGLKPVLLDDLVADPRVARHAGAIGEDRGGAANTA